MKFKKMESLRVSTPNAKAFNSLKEERMATPWRLSMQSDYSLKEEDIEVEAFAREDQENKGYQENIEAMMRLFP